MTEGKHTPGKWAVRFHPNGDPEEFIVQAERQPGQAVAQTIMEHTFYPTKLADAKLIASAPELVKAREAVWAGVPDSTRGIIDSNVPGMRNSSIALIPMLPETLRLLKAALTTAGGKG